MTASANGDRYSIDVRLFLAAITTAMAIAFGVGVAVGPNEYPLEASQEVFVEHHAPKLTSRRRLPTAHSADLGQLEETHVHFEEPTYQDLGDGASTVVHVPSSTKADGDGDDSAEHRPAGQHLLVDMNYVNADFLNSEERLAKAMVDVVAQGNFTLLSYHCHALVPKGVSCVGVILESHISFHTWPDEGVITLDLFTCGSSLLIPMVPVIEALFAIPRPTGEEVETRWAHELRGFRKEEERKKHYLDDQSDLSFWVVSGLDILVKNQIVSMRSKYQQIDIWDTMDVDDTPTYFDGLKAGLTDDDPQWLTTEVATPMRLLFLDGTLQSISESEREYHEALVHPAMFAHPGPQHVAIVGGGEGATLREVLKHNTIKSAVMIEIDEELVQVAREHLPVMSNCSDLVGRADSCFEDDLAQVVYEDGRKWFVDRYGPNPTVPAKHKFDVVIVDALDPEDQKTEMSNMLYSDVNFISSLLDSLTDIGVLVVQVGTAPSIHDPRADMGVYSNREILFRLLEAQPQVATMLVYEESHCGFDEPHSFLAVCRNVECRQRWYANSDAIDYEIYNRTVPTRSNKEPTLVHFDGSTQHSYQVPPRAWETVYCRREPTPVECDYRGLDLSKAFFEVNLDEPEKSHFSIEHVRDNGETAAVYAKVNIPKGSYIMPDHMASSFVILNQTISNLEENTRIVGTGGVAIIEDFLEYIDEYGHDSLATGNARRLVEVGISALIRDTSDPTKANVGRWMPPLKEVPTYSPVYDRHLMSFDVFLVATKDIMAGEELFALKDLWD